MPVKQLERLIAFVAQRSPEKQSNTTDKLHDSSKWRETLQDFVVSCYLFPRPKASVGGQFSAENDLRSVSSKLRDVIKPQEPTQKDFLRHLDLERSRESVPKMPSKPNANIRMLINNPQIPFSSDFGRLLTSSRVITEDILVRRLNRVERYLDGNATDVPLKEYPVVPVKTQVPTRKYTVPSRQFRRSERLSLKATLLKKIQCKPCFVRLELVKDLCKREVSEAPADLPEAKCLRDVRVVLSPMPEKRVELPSVCMDVRVIITPIPNRYLSTIKPSAKRQNPISREKRHPRTASLRLIKGSKI